MRLALLSITGSLFFLTASTLPAASDEELPLVVPLFAPAAGQKLLIIAPADEQAYLKTACQQLRMAADFTGSFDARRRDYKPFHAVLVGTNQMDYWGGMDTKAPEAFQPIVDFVASGGHLLMFGTYYGRNMQHLNRFGIEAGAWEGSGFVRVPHASDALFAGSESFVPKDGSLSYLGWFSIDRPHVVLLRRPGGDPAVATTPFGDGRVTIMMVEPNYRNDFWLYRVILGWHVRGAPSRLWQLGMFGAGTISDDATKQAVPSDDDIDRQQQEIQRELESDYRQLKPWNPTLGKELARKLLSRTNAGGNPVDNFALLMEARDLAAKSGDAATVLNAIEASSQTFQVDALAMLQDGLSKSSSASRSAADCRTVVDVALTGATTAIAAKQFDIADELLKLAGGNATRARVADLPKQVAAMKQAVSEARKAAAK